jgi:multidrug efflux pump
MGLTTSQIDATLGDAFTQAQVSTIYDPFSPQQYHVVMEVAPPFWQNPDALKNVYVSTYGGAVSGVQSTSAVPGTTVSFRSETVVPLSAFSRLSTTSTPAAVNHTGTSASTSIAFNLPAGEPLSVALAAIDRTMQRIHMPSTIHGGTYGTARVFQQSSSSEPLMLLASFAAIYVVLGMLYESFSQPLTILSTLPSAGVGALLALMATGNEFSLIAFLAILLLIGIVKKNAIMMVDVAIDGQRNHGLDPRTAIARACVLRFRPIMMTTCAAIAGALPLAIASGNGTELRRPLGISMIGGLLVSQLLTLYTTPVVYLYVDRLRARAERRAQRRAVLGTEFRQPA